MSQRQAAEGRGDSAALREIRARTRTRAATNTSAIQQLRQDVERIKDNHQRSVSSVSYDQLGIAHHDGTRIRANSNESERMGLLSDAASIAAVSTRSGAHSPRPPPHTRDRSVSSIGSIDSDFPSPRLGPPSTRSRAGSQPNTPRLSSGAGARAGSSPELVEADLGDEHMPPPEYEEVSLDDEDGDGSSANMRTSLNNDSSNSLHRSTTPLHEPPPDYPGPYRSSSIRSERDLSTVPSTGEGSERPSGARTGSEPQVSTRGVGGVPQLPSLRIAHLPEIVIEPSSALPQDNH